MSKHEDLISLHRDMAAGVRKLASLYAQLGSQHHADRFAEAAQWNDAQVKYFETLQIQERWIRDKGLV